MFVQLKFLDCVTFEMADLTAQFTFHVVSSRPKLSSFIFLMLSTSSSIAMWSKDFLLEFIELFRQEECLWKVKSKDYYNRSKKDASDRKLIGKVQEVEPDATQDTVVK
jgi:hypothetical protein